MCAFCMLLYMINLSLISYHSTVLMDRNHMYNKFVASAQLFNKKCHIFPFFHNFSLVLQYSRKAADAASVQGFYEMHPAGVYNLISPQATAGKYDGTFEVGRCRIWYFIYLCS